MSLWNVYAGTCTENFPIEIQRLNQDTKAFWAGRHPGFLGTLSKGLERYSFDDVTGTLRHEETISGDIFSPQTVAVHPTLPVVYAAEFARPGRLLAFGVRSDGTVERRSTVESFGQLAFGLSVHPNGNFVYVSHWGDGTLTAFPLDDEGMLTSAHLIARDEARDGAEPHHHDVRLTPNANALLVPDIGLDQLTAYRAEPDGRIVSEPIVRIGFPEGSSPRNIELHPTGHFVYVNGEHDSMLHVLDAEEGVPRNIVGSYPTRPPGYEGSNTPSEMRLHPDGRTLYAGNRGSNSITIFEVDDAGGVETLGHQSTLGVAPKALRIDPSGRYLIVGHRNTSNVVVFAISPDRRRLQPLGSPVEGPAESLVFLGAST